MAMSQHLLCSSFSPRSQTQFSSPVSSRSPSLKHRPHPHPPHCRPPPHLYSRTDDASSAQNRLAVFRTPCLAQQQPALASSMDTIRIHYHRKCGTYEMWGLHVWGDTDVTTSWESPLVPSGRDDFGVFWDIKMPHGGTAQFIVHQGDVKDCSGSVTNSGAHELWMLSENDEIMKDKPDLSCIQKGNLRLAMAYWVKRDLIAWPSDIEGCECFLHASKSADLNLSGNEIEGSDLIIKLEKSSEGLPLEVIQKFPHIKDYVSMNVPSVAPVADLLKCQLALVIKSEDGILVDATGVQICGVLDDLFAYDGPLGISYTTEGVKLSLWAPTAQKVKLLVYSAPSGSEPGVVIDLLEENGVWIAHGPKEWDKHYYVYEIMVFHPLTQKIEVSIANDPYSRGLSANGERSLMINLDSPETQPNDWNELALEKPTLKSFMDIAIYELHIRDFSISDESVDSCFQGTYLAFTAKGSNGMSHLKQLAEAGLTHVHLLPSYDFGSVDEIKENWKYVDSKNLARFPPDSEHQQTEIVAIKDEDGYNWGYDPVNWGVPDGSYATDPYTSKRCLEFRQMVQALNRLGLRVVLDVVYNHLYGNGPHSRYSVLDKVVPGYYLRRNTKGEIENSTCMNNTASEHYMVDRLIVDDLLHWAVDYKVDGFRFDLMGHLMKRTVIRAKEALRRLTVDCDGIDGSKIYLYGEGWDFGEVACNGRGENAVQCNLAGTGIGSFNDHIRDSVIGGSPFADPRMQGFLTGLHLRPNDLDQGGHEATRNALLATSDWIRVAMAGNLRGFSFINYLGKEIKGEDITHDNKPVAYAASPEETVNYVSAHDNETLFDIIMLKTARDVSLQERCRINSLASSMVALAQGIPFFHAGDDILRSKSLDRDSYNSGDWFNRLDFTYESNNWGVGLPPKEKNGNKWPIMRGLLSDMNLVATKENILVARENFKVFLKIRFSSPLFRLPTASEIQQRVKFHNTGPASILGVIAMSIEDGDEAQNNLQQIDPLYKSIIVIFNARPDGVSIDVPFCKGKAYSLHHLQAEGVDDLVKESTYAKSNGEFWIPHRTTAVFVEGRKG